MSTARIAAVAATLALAAGVLTLGSGGAPGATASAAEPAERYEVWAVDQTDSRPGFGGYLHVFAGSALEREPAEPPRRTIDLGGQASDLCRAETGANPVRPHMLAFNGGDDASGAGARFAILAWVASGHVSIHDAGSGEAIACLRTSPGAGGARQAHAAWPTADGRHILVANQNGKQVERIRSDWAGRSFAWEPEAKLSLSEGQTPAGAPRQDPVLRPDNAPICARTTRDDRFAFVSLRGGGAFVIDHRASPMAIVAEYDRAHVDDNGCGQVEAGGRMYLNAGAGAPGDRYGHTVYAVDLAGLPAAGRANTPAPRPVIERQGEVDAHGLAVIGGGKYLLSFDRIQNDVTVLGVRKHRALGSFSLAGGVSADPAPDLVAPSPDGKLLFTALRGPTPLSGGHDATGATPGVGVVRLRRGGKDGALVSVAPTPRSAGVPDPHAIAVRVLR